MKRLKRLQFLTDILCVYQLEPGRLSGLGIFFSKDGKTVDWNDLISITEYNSVFKNIQTVGFQQGQENYVAAIRFEDGNIIEE